MPSSTKSCVHTKPDYKILFDIGNGNTEEVFVCNQCYSSNECMRKWILEIEEISK